MNRITISGRMGNDPRITQFHNGDRMASFRIATNKRQLNQETGQWEDTAVWHNIRAYSSSNGGVVSQLQADIFTKGTYVVISGTLQYQDIQPDDKNERRSRIAYIDIRHTQDLEFVMQSKRAIDQNQSKQRPQEEKATPAAPTPAPEAKAKIEAPPTPEPTAPTPSPTENDMIGGGDEAEEEI